VSSPLDIKAEEYAIIVSPFIPKFLKSLSQTGHLGLRREKRGMFNTNYSAAFLDPLVKEGVLALGRRKEAWQMN
jgi:hypothetical protein